MPLVTGTADGERLFGGSGNDTLDGGGGDDWLEDSSGGSDHLLGGAGRDQLYLNRFPGEGSASATLDGGDGNDSIAIGPGSLRLTVSALGGAGDDFIGVIGSSVRGVIDGGVGDDTVSLAPVHDGIAVSMAAGGTDTLALLLQSPGALKAATVVEGFQPGDGGDVVQFVDLFAPVAQRLSNTDQTNPFGSGHFRLVQSGADVLLQIDEDGGANSFRDLLRFTNTTAGAFTASNFSGYPPSGATPLGRVVTEPRPANGAAVIGGVGADTISGQSPNDWIKGGDGADSINGGEGGDSLYGEAGADTVSGGLGADTIIDTMGANYLRGDDGEDYIAGGGDFDDINGNMGADTADGGAGDDWVISGKDNDLLRGQAGGDLVYGNIGSDHCDGGDGNDIVRGGQGDDYVWGGDGDDFVSGDRGTDTVGGGGGADIFHTFGDAGIDRVTDFNLAQGDRVQLDPGTQYTVSQVGADTVIDMTGGGQMVLVGVQMSTLTTGWIFGA